MAIELRILLEPANLNNVSDSKGSSRSSSNIDTLLGKTPVSFSHGLTVLSKTPIQDSKLRIYDRSFEVVAPLPKLFSDLVDMLEAD